MRRLWLGVLLLAGVALCGCSRPTKVTPAPPVDWNHAADAAVFQVYTEGGMMPPLYYETLVPEVTVFGDGRMLFWRQGGPVLEARLPEQKLGDLLARANRDLTGLKEEYSAAAVTDVGYTWFTAVTAGGKRQVRVYAFADPPWDREDDRDVMDRLRSLRRAFLDAAPADAKPYVPAQLKVVTSAIEQPASAVYDWPADLPALPLPPSDHPYEIAKATLRGEEAHKVAVQVGYRSQRIYRVGGRYLMVEAAPVVERVAPE